ncbi:MAG: phosphate signaling complex protein PhoU [Deltaproteobacteria bacterium]|nr:phosphate signaling complex protein PhoU [Deltaproteobacteria bacterium]
MTTHTEHTSKHYEHDLKELRDKILLIGGHVEELIANSMKALIQSDSELAKKSIKLDQEINRLEKQIDELCINILALRQPTASDLRFIITSLKIVTDLERMGDLGVNIAQRALELLKEPPLKPYIHLPILAQMAQKMMKDALDALVKGGESLAESVMGNDDAVDELTHKIIDELMILMREDPNNINRGVKLISVAKYLERLADHATNVAEMVLFLMRGEDVRHPALRNSPLQ